MIYKLEDFVLDLNQATRAHLYYKDKVFFIGDGYKAIKILIANCNNKQAAQHTFRKQLSQRERPRFKDLEKKSE